MERKRRVGMERSEGIGARKRQRGACLIIMEVGRKKIEDRRRYRSCEIANVEVQLFGPTCFVSGIFRSMTIDKIPPRLSFSNRYTRFTRGSRLLH